VPHIFEEPIDLPYIPDDLLLARKLLRTFNVYTAGDGGPAEREDGDRDDPNDFILDEGTEMLAIKLSEILQGIRSDPLARRYIVPARRNAQGGWLGELWRLMEPLGCLWTVDIAEGELPSGPFSEPEVGDRPAANTGADFIYMGLRGMGLQFSDEEFREQFFVMLRDLRSTFEEEEPMEDDA
jgi:hypothetical protein